MITLFFSVFASLFTVVNPFGTMPIFVGLTQNDTKERRASIAFRASLFMMIILIVSFLGGKYMIQFFGISIESLRIAGGLIIASSGFALLTGTFSKHKGMSRRVKDDAFKKEDTSLTPLAIPMLAGPGSISLLIGLNETTAEIMDWVVVMATVVAVSLVTYLILRSSHFMISLMGASGLNAISRIIGFIVIALGIEYILSSIQVFVKLCG
ncbi:MAG: MarC family protein [Marinifilaceae bacterium]